MRASRIDVHSHFMPEFYWRALLEEGYSAPTAGAESCKAHRASAPCPVTGGSRMDHRLAQRVLKRSPSTQHAISSLAIKAMLVLFSSICPSDVGIGRGQQYLEVG